MRLLLITGLLACTSANANATPDTPVTHSQLSAYLSGWSIYTEVNVWRAFDAIPISEFESDWSKGYSPREGRNTFLQRGIATVGVARNGWRLAYEVRQEASITTDRSTLDAIYLYKQRQKPVPPAFYTLDVKYSAWTARGIRVGREFAGPPLAAGPIRLDISGAVYTHQRLRQINAAGTLSYPQTDTYEFDAAQNEVDSRMTYPFMRHTASASGASVSIAAAVPITPALTLSMRADDILSRIRWKNIPVMSQTLSSNVTSYDENGYINYRPMLSGQNRQIDKTFRIDRYTEAALSYQHGPWGTSAKVARYAGEYIPTFSVAHHFAWFTASASVETRFKSVGLGLERGNFRVLVQTDNVDLDKSKAQAVQLQYRLKF